MARTTVNIDDDALARAQRLFALESPSAVVNVALREVLRRADLEGFEASRDIELEVGHDDLRSWRDDRA